MAAKGDKFWQSLYKLSANHKLLSIYFLNIRLDMSSLSSPTNLLPLPELSWVSFIVSDSYFKGSKRPIFSTIIKATCFPISLLKIVFQFLNYTEPTRYFHNCDRRWAHFRHASNARKWFENDLSSPFFSGQWRGLVPSFYYWSQLIGTTIQHFIRTIMINQY